MAGVEISYNNSVIATINARGTETLDTEGKFLTNNIEIVYTAGSSYPTYNGEHHQPTPSGYTVTVSLTNPQNSRYFASCTIFEGLSDDPYDFGQQLGQINSATGSAEVMVSSSLYGIVVNIGGASVGIDSSGISCTGGVSYSSNTDDYAVFSVTGNGTATIDGVDYDY